MRIKALLVLFFVVLLYFSFDYLVIYRFYQLTPLCANQADLVKLESNLLSEAEKLTESKKIWQCIESKQYPIEKLIIKVPDKWKE